VNAQTEAPMKNSPSRQQYSSWYTINPSGILKPGAENHETTRRLKKVGGIISIQIINHLIFSEFDMKPLILLTQRKTAYAVAYHTPSDGYNPMEIFIFFTTQSLQSDQANRRRLKIITSILAMSPSIETG